MVSVQDKGFRENKTHILCSINFFPKNHGFYEIMWKNMVEPDIPQMTV